MTNAPCHNQILQLLAYQIGKEVSFNEIGQQVGLNKKTIEHYIDLLEKTFVLVNISGFSRNLRKEVTKQSRYYFYDIGVRNAIINQFAPLPLRNDIGEMWENLIVSERLKYLYNNRDVAERMGHEARIAVETKQPFGKAVLGFYKEILKREARAR